MMNEFIKMMMNAKTVTISNDSDYKVTAVMLSDDEFLLIKYLDGEFFDCQKSYFGENSRIDDIIITAFPEYSDFV